VEVGVNILPPNFEGILAKFFRGPIVPDITSDLTLLSDEKVKPPMGRLGKVFL
jgi:hypothetical protein